MGLLILSDGQSITIAHYRAELQEDEEGILINTLIYILRKCVVGIQGFEGQIRLLELKEAIYAPCNFHFEVPPI